MSDIDASAEVTEPAIAPGEQVPVDFDASVLAALEAEFAPRTAPAEPETPEPEAPADPTVVDETEPPAPVEPERILTEPPADDWLVLGDLTVDKATAEQQLRWVQSLTPEQYARLATPPVEEAAPAGSMPAPAGAAPAPLPDLAVLAEVEPGLVPFLQGLASTQQAQQQQWAEFQAAQARQQASAAQQEQARVNAEIATADQAFRSAHPEIHPDDVTQLVADATRMQVFPALVAQHGGDVTKAYEATLETAMWANPRFRDRMLQEAVNKHASIAADAQQRSQRAASLTGSGATVSRTPPSTPDTRGMDRQTLNSAIAAELETHLSQQ